MLVGDVVGEDADQLVEAAAFPLVPAAVDVREQRLVGGGIGHRKCHRQGNTFAGDKLGRVARKGAA